MAAARRSSSTPKPGTRSLSVYANDPDQLKDEPPELVGAVQQAVSTRVRPFRELISRNQTNWARRRRGRRGLGRARVSRPAAARSRSPRLWDAIGRLCRLDRPDPVAAWETAPGGARARGAIT